MEGKKSRRGRVGEGRPTKRTPEVVAKIAEAVATGLTHREAGLLAAVRHDTMTEWCKDPEFSEAVKGLQCNGCFCDWGASRQENRGGKEQPGH